jgi:hypothetical protein
MEVKMVKENTNKKNLTAYVPKEFFNRVTKFIDKENAKPENSGIKMKQREFIIKAIVEYLDNHGG